MRERAAITIRSYRAETDAAELERMWERTFADRWPLSGGELGRILASQDVSHNGWTDVAIGEKLVGLVAYQQRRGAPEQGTIAAINVDPHVRRHGIGSALICAALKRLKDLGVTEVELGAWASPRFWHGVPADCGEAKRFFASLGWSFYEENADLILDLRTFDIPPRVRLTEREFAVSFRTAREDESSNLLRFVKSEFSPFLDYYENEIKSNGLDHISLAEIDSQPVAAIIVTTFPFCSGSHWHKLLGERFGVMGAGFVRRDLRRRGIGLAIAAHACAHLRALDCDTCYLHWTWMLEMYSQLGARLWRKYSMGKIDLRASSGPSIGP